MKHVRRAVFLLLGGSSMSELCADVSEHSICPIFIGHVNKNNWDETARVFILVTVWLKRSLD